MHVLWLLAARRFRRRRAVSTITASSTAPATPCGNGWGEDDDGPFFDLDLSCCSAPASSAGSSSESEDSSSSSCAGGEAGFVISLQRRSCSASPSYDERLSFGRCGWGGALPPQLKFCASEPNDHAAAARFGASGRRGRLRTLSFGSAKAAFYGGRASFSRSCRSARSARLFAAYDHSSPEQDLEQEIGAKRTTPSTDVIRRYLSRISRRLRRVAPGTGAAADLRLRKSRSVPAAQTAARASQFSSPSRRDDTLLEKQDGIASAIAHCKESIHRASMSECDSSLVRSWSDPGT